VLAHSHLLRAKWKWNTKDQTHTQDDLSRALTLAERHENDWVKLEVYALQSPERAVDLANRKGWENRTRWLERGAAWGR
jgi:cell division protein FtsL